MGLESVSGDGDAVIEAGGKDGRRCLLTHVAGTTRRLSPAGMLGVYIRQPERAGQFPQIRSGPSLENTREGEPNGYGRYSLRTSRQWEKL